MSNSVQPCSSHSVKFPTNLLPEKPFCLINTKLVKGVQPGRKANALKNKSDKLNGNKLPLDNNIIAVLNIILNFQVDVNTKLKTNIEPNDFNINFIFNQNNFLLLESVM